MLNNSVTEFNKDKKNNLYIVLACVFLTNAILAEIIGVKIFSVDKLFGWKDIGKFFESNMHFDLTAGVIIWPIVFLTTDIINEYYGKEGVKKITYMASVLLGYGFLTIYLVTLLPPADFWLELNNTDYDGNSLDINAAFSKLLRQGIGIYLGSITAFMIGQIVDVYTFHYIRKLTGNTKIWLRATGSTVVSQIIDSFVVLTVAFYIFGNWSFSQVLAVGLINYIYKVILAVALTPMLYVAHGIIDKYLGVKESEKMIEEANKSYEETV